MQDSDALAREGQPSSHAAGERLWYAVYTRSRHEKAVDRSLRERGIESFLPAVDVLSQWKDRRKLVRKPLFPGYLFALASRPDVTGWRAIRGVVDIVGDGQGPVPVPEQQVLSVRRLVEASIHADPWPYMKEGRTVRVTKGPLAGLDGFIVKRKRIYRLVISVDLLGRSVAAEVNADCLEVD